MLSQFLPVILFLNEVFYVWMYGEEGRGRWGGAREENRLVRVEYRHGRDSELKGKLP